MRFCSRALVFIVVGAWILIGARASAQETGRIGLSIGYPTTVGLLWQISTRVGLRPEMTLDVGSSESISTSRFGESRFSSDFWDVGIGLSALILVHRADDLVVYLSPRYRHSRGKSTAENTSSPGIALLGNDDSDTTGHTFAGAAGAHYSLGRRFGVFGELGVSHEQTDTVRSPDSRSESSFDSRFTRTGLRSGVGVVVFF
jgi:hypothetical protein